MPALNTTTGVIVAGGDIEGFFLTQDYGDHWRIVNNGIYQQYWHQCACIVWSVTESNTLYAGVGNAGASGGFLVSTNGGWSWSLRSATPQFAGNHAASPLPSGGQPRSTGNLIAQGGGNIFVATYSQGVYISGDNGNTWTNIGLSGGSYYARSLAIDPASSSTLYVAMYNSNIWKTTNATAATPTWTQLTGAPSIVEELKIVGTYLYAACGTSGIYRSTDGGTTWTSLNGSFINTTQSQWLSIDGYVSGSSHVIIVGCYNGVKPGSGGYRNIAQLTINSVGAVTYTDLSTTIANISLSIPPEGRSFWESTNDSGYQNWLGGSSYTAGYVLIDPTDTNRIFVTGDEGMFRSYDGGNTWQIAVNGMALMDARGIVVDPANSSRVFFGSSDWTSFLISDGIGYDASTVSLEAPGTGTEGYAVAIDPVDSTLYLAMGERSTNAEGQVWHLPSGSTTWVNDSVPGGGNVPIGIAVGRDASNNRYVLAAVWSSGLYRLSGDTWTQVSSTIAADTQNTEFLPFTALAGSQYVYAMDRHSGVYRSTDYGVTWTLIYGFNSDTATTGYLAINPAVANELWVSTKTGLYKISGANSGTVGSGLTATSITAMTTPGAIKITSTGTIFCISIPTLTSSTTLMRSIDGGTTWESVGDAALAGSASRPNSLEVGANGHVYVGTLGNGVSVGYNIGQSQNV
jgi:hypothetical protein